MNLRPSGVSYLSTVWHETIQFSLRLQGKNWTRGQRKEVPPLPTHQFAWLIWLCYHTALAVSLLLFLLILHYSLEKPTPAFIGHLRGSKTSSSLGIKESSCYLYLKRNGLIGMSPLPGQLLIPSTHIRHMVRQKSLIGYVFLGKLLNPCASVSSSNTLTVALWSENPEPEHPAKPHQIPDPQKWWDIGCFKPLNFGVMCYMTIDIPLWKI